MSDGYPSQNIIATDLRQDFWNLGFELFKDDASKFPVSFVRGDILSPTLLDTGAKKLDTRPDLSKGPLSCGVEDQLKVARGCVSLLTGLSGATVFGAHIGAPKSGLFQKSDGKSMFCHSPESWEEMWKEAIKIMERDTEVRVWAKLIEMGDDPLFSGGRGYMAWGVELV
ncbi:hypothetical protein FRC10_010225 [Ceratobasidium sp. 414]|nr:hypothetical protein FRC10_010225 [Ceratobasidium sp. 414]